MRQVGAAVDELVGARQRRREHRVVEVERTLGAIFLQRVVQRIEPRRDVRPVLQRLLQRRRDAAGAHCALQVAIDNDEGAVAAAFLE